MRTSPPAIAATTRVVVAIKRLLLISSGTRGMNEGWNGLECRNGEDLPRLDGRPRRRMDDPFHSESRCFEEVHIHGLDPPVEKVGLSCSLEQQPPDTPTDHEEHHPVEHGRDSPS